MTDKQYRYVQALAQAGSFSRAAELLGISQPSLSQYIKKIENEVGMPLFHRNGQELGLTDAGRLFTEAGEKILALEKQLAADLSDLAEARAGSLVVGTAPYRSADLMPLVVKRFQQLYPGIHIVIKEGTSAELLEGMERGAYDLCLTVQPPESPLYCREKIMDEELILAQPMAWEPLDSRSGKAPDLPETEAAELTGKPFVMLTEAQLMQKALRQLCREAGISVKKAAVVKSLEAQISMVKAGVGMALVPEGIRRLCREDQVRFYALPQPGFSREVVLIWRRDHKLSASAQALKQVIKEVPAEIR